MYIIYKYRNILCAKASSYLPYFYGCKTPTYPTLMGIKHQLTYPALMGVKHQLTYLPYCYRHQRINFCLFCEAHHCGVFIQKCSSIVTVFLSLTHSHVSLYDFFPHMYILHYASSPWLQCAQFSFFKLFTIIIKHFRLTNLLTLLLGA